MNFDQADALNGAIRAVGTRHRAVPVAALAPMGIHPGHKLLLLELAAGPRTQAQLAAASGYEPPSITESVRQLETAGLIVRRPSRTDARATMVELSDQLVALEKISSRAITIWSAVSIAALVISLSFPLVAGTTTSAKASLALMHVAVATILIATLRRG